MSAPLEMMPDTFTTSGARQRGVHPRDLYRWRDSGLVIELSRGVFRRSDAPPASLPDLLAVSYRVPYAIICCVSAAAVYDLTDDLPMAVQIAVPSYGHAPRIDHPPTSGFRFNVDTFELGLTHVEAAPGESVRIYDPTRTVVDLMRLRHRFGEPVAHTALRRLIDQGRSRGSFLLDYAADLGVHGPIRHALDVAMAQ